MTPPIIAMANQKGGVGKTTSTLLSASSLASRGFNVLVLDMDQQGNSTTALLGPPRFDERTKEWITPAPQTPGVFGLTCDPNWPQGGMKLSDVIEPAADAWGTVDFAAGSQQLALVDTDMDPSQPGRLRRAFRAQPEILANYDVVLLDCPPAVGRVMFAALVAATHYVIVTEPTGASVEGMGRIESTVVRVREATERDTPELLAVMVNRMRRTTERATRLAEVFEGYGETCLFHRDANGKTSPLVINERSAVDDAYSTGVPIHAVQSEGGKVIALQIDAMWDQLVDRLGLPRRQSAA